MINIRLVAAGFLLLLVSSSGYRFSRWRGLLDSFHDYDTIDNDPDLNDVGVTVGLEESFSVFGESYGVVTLYDTGYVSLDPSKDRVDANDLNGDPIIRQHPYIAPNWIPDWNQYSYQMAYRQAHVNKTKHIVHDLDLINAEVNRALDQYPETWTCHNALIVTWSISRISDATKYDKFQLVMASGRDGTGASQDYVLLLYEVLDLEDNERPFIYVNGYYNNKNQAKMAGVCSADRDFQFLKTYSNYKCGNYGVYLLDMKDGEHCDNTEIEQCALGTSTNDNCKRPTNEPVDTCTETFTCYLNEDQTAIEGFLGLKYYPFSQVSGIDYLSFIGSGTHDAPGDDGVFVYVDDANCAVNTDSLANAGTPLAQDLRTFSTPLADGLGNCGVQVDTTAQTMRYAFAIYDPSETDVLKDGYLGVYGQCHYMDLPRGVSVTVKQNGPATPTRLPDNPKFVEMAWVDGDGNPLDSAEIGDLIHAQLCFDPGQFYNLNTDPFGIYAVNCYIGNNEALINAASPSTDRSVQTIENGCVALPDDLAFYFAETFQVVPPGTKGETWCIRTGEMDAEKFEVIGGSSKIWLGCTYNFCTLPDETLCEYSCGSQGGGRGSRSVKAHTNATGQEFMKISLDIKEQSEGSESTQEPTCAVDHVDSATVIATVGLLVAIIVVLCVFAVIMFAKLMKQKR